MQELSGAREAALPHHFDEDAQPARVERYSHMEWIL
jgi:hypothetical protein